MRTFVIVGTMLLGAHAAHAEQILGEVRAVDSEANRLTLSRAETGQEVTVNVKDGGSLADIQPGTQVIVDAEKGFFGGYTADSVAGTGPVAGSDTQGSGIAS